MTICLQDRPINHPVFYVATIDVDKDSVSISL
jgi:hypothetical protein